MIKHLLLLMPLVLCCVPFGFADTVFFKDGTTLDGVVTRPNADTIVIQIGKGKTTFAAVDVANVEMNDKKGDNLNINRIHAQRRADFLLERTGLTREQRDRVRDAIDPLWSPDEATRNAARKKLVAMSNEMSVFKYIVSTLPYSKGLVVPELMRVLVDIDPKQAKNVLGQRSQDLDPRNRARALELLGSYKKPEDLDTVARGMVDLDPRVQIAAAHGLAVSGQKGTTPVLLEGLKSNDMKVRNACREALKQLWSTANTAVDFETANEWRGYWNTKAARVENVIKASGLTPLVTPEDLENVNPEHDE